jgi:hypothetical protein
MARALLRFVSILLLLILIQFDMKKVLLAHATSGAFILEQIGAQNPLWVNFVISLTLSPFFLILSFVPELKFIQRIMIKYTPWRIVIILIVGLSYALTLTMTGYSASLWIKSNLTELIIYTAALPAALLLFLYNDLRKLLKTKRRLES